MNRAKYNLVRRSIRDNGMRHTYQECKKYDPEGMLICLDLMVIAEKEDALAERAKIAKSESPSIAFFLTH